MKSNILRTIIIISAAAAFAACNTGNSSRNGKDTADIKYNQTPNVDTNKVTTTTGDASNVDNSGSGGTKTAKDSVLKQNKDTTKR